MKRYLTLLVAVFSTILSVSQVLPEIELGVKGVVSANIGVNNNGVSSAVSDFSDSQILLGFRQKLYNKWRGQMVFGMQFPDADSDLGQVFYNHVFIQVEDQKNIIKIGRSTTRTILNEFPTLRDDDAMNFNYSLNPFSKGSNTQDNQYGNVIEYTHIFAQRYWLSFHGENFSDLSKPENFELNSFGFSLLYVVPESQLWNREILQRLGFSYNSYATNEAGYEGFDRYLKNILGTITLNVLPDPVHLIDFKVQGVYNIGFARLDSIKSYSDYVRTPSMATFATLRYLYRKLERPLLQVSVGFGLKSFELLPKSKQGIFISNVFYRVGENFDIGFQYRYLQNNGEVADLFSSSAHRFQFAFVYSINQIFNKHFDDRNSILNLEHNYIN